jgi:hypothetical protein
MFGKKPIGKSKTELTFHHSDKKLNMSTTASRSSQGFSLPSDWGQKRANGILKFLTHDESLHYKYGSGKGAEAYDRERARRLLKVETPEEALLRRKIQFADLFIREYDRTIGDNPSCTSGRKYCYEELSYAVLFFVSRVYSFTFCPFSANKVSVLRLTASVAGASMICAF